MGEMRRRMEAELRLRRYSERTVQSYLLQMARLVRHYRRPPEELGREEIRAYVLHMTEEEGLAVSTVNQAIYAIRFFYTEVLGRPWEERFNCQRQRQRKLPQSLERS